MEATTPDRERILVSQARGGDLKSFSALVEIYQERAVHMAYSFVGNFEDAKDIAQDAFVKAYQGLESFNEQSRFYTWLYRILVNTCKDFLRKRKIRQTVSFWLKPDGNEEGTPFMADVATRTKNPQEELANRELGAQISKAVERLPFQQKSAFLLRYIEGLGIEDIALSMGISPGAVKATLWQAAQKMKNFLRGSIIF